MIRRGVIAAACVGAGIGGGASGREAEPFRLQAMIAGPDWLSIEGETRARYETLDGQFRAGGSGGDQILALRTLLRVEADAGPVSFGLELQDARTYLDDAGTPLSPSIVNPLDVLQLYARFDDITGPFGPNWTSAVTLGRQTFEIGSQRRIDRISFANVIRSYTGVYARADSARGDEMHAFLVAPVARLPADRDSVGDNRLSGDEEQWGRRFWGLHYRRADAAPGLASDLWAEAYVYGLDEDDTDAFPTPNRAYVEPGGRLYRAPAAGRWDMDVEAALRVGARRASSDPADTEDLDVLAATAVLAAGYTFQTAWTPRLALEYYYASGDEDPDDGDFDQYERLFGARRTDLGNTSIHGPLTVTNLSGPGARVEVKPGPRWDARAYYRAAYLASDTDVWAVGRRRDPTGASGDFIGHTLDARARYWLIPDSVRLEVGASALWYGDFAQDAPSPPAETDRTLFGYVQVDVSF